LSTYDPFALCYHNQTPAPLIGRLKENNFYENLFKTQFNKKFVQVGAHKHQDSHRVKKLIIENLWEGTLIEPIDYLYKELVDLYKSNEKIKILNVAIGNSNIFFTVNQEVSKKEDCPHYWSMISSFDRDFIIRHNDNYFEKYIEQINVTSVHLKNVVLDKIDYLFVDAEGYDDEVIYTFDFSVCKPNIVYEWYHLTDQKNIRLWKYLKKLGYNIYREKWTGECDCVAIFKGNK
jgi:FkbM family methyltransferase